MTSVSLNNLGGNNGELHNDLELSSNEDINRKLRTYFDGKIVRKDLTKSIKEGANVPVYVLEFLLGQYCSSDDPSIIEDGVANVKRILADNYVRPDEAQKILSLLRQREVILSLIRLRLILILEKIPTRQNFLILELKLFQYQKNIQASMTVYSVVAFGVLFNLNMNT